MGSSKKKKIIKKSTNGPSEKKINPFELKFNKVKYDVLGKKKGSASVGHPGLSKKKAIEIRKKTIGVQHERIGKVNKIVDKRIGERDSDMTAEEKASLRFMAERSKSSVKSNKFNLADADEEETLTHGGKTLTSIQKYDRTAVSDDEDDMSGNIGAKIVKMAHFGGGEESTGATRKDLINDMIARSKQSKQQKSEMRDQQETLTTKLDEKFAKLMGKVTATFRPVGASKDEKQESDSYDKLALAMKLDAEPRATPAERTKTDAERAADEKGRLEELEQRRLARMNAKTNANIHNSVDVDVVGIAKAKKPKTGGGFVVRFDEKGELMDRDKMEKNSMRKVARGSDDEGASESDSDIEDEHDEDLDDMLNSSDDEGAAAVDGGNEEGEEDADDSGDEDEEEEDEDDDDEGADISDLDDIQGDDEQSVPSKKSSAAVCDAPVSEDTEIPYVFTVPTKYSGLRALLSQYPTNKMGLIFERIVKCNHPSLKAGNKQMLSKLFLLLLRLYDDMSKKTPSAETTVILGTLTKTLYTIMKFDVEYGVRCVRALIRQNWRLRLEKARRAPPSFAVVALMRLVASLFPVSDVWHPVCTPTMALAAVTMYECQITSLTVLARQVLIATTIGDFVEESKRYVPEVMAFLQGALLLAVENVKDERAPSVAFPVSHPHNQMLYIEKPCDEAAELAPLRLSEVFHASNTDVLENTDVNRARILRAVIAIVQKFRLIYATHENSFTVIFRPIVALLKRIPMKHLPAVLAEELEALIQSTEAECVKRSRLTQLSQVKTEKTMLKMLEPLLEDNFDPDRPRLNRDPSRKGPSAENNKMKYLYKQEMRGAIKEIRKDGTFLRRKERKEKFAVDQERKQKTKRIMSGLQEQQGEWNKEIFLKERDKKRRKRQF